MVSRNKAENLAFELNTTGGHREQEGTQQMFNLKRLSPENVPIIGWNRIKSRRDLADSDWFIYKWVQTEFREWNVKRLMLFYWRFKNKRAQCGCSLIEEEKNGRSAGLLKHHLTQNLSLTMHTQTILLCHLHPHTPPTSTPAVLDVTHTNHFPILT